MRIAGDAHIGHVRPRNEDTIAWDESCGVAALADGMGGHPAGDVASRTAVDEVMAIAREAGDDLWLDAGGDPAAAVLAAHRAVLEHGRREPDAAGMGSTLVVAAIGRSGVTLSHVGDSRAYRLHTGRLERLTHDHNVAQEAVDQGWLTLDQARLSPGRHQLTQALGVVDAPRPEVVRIERQPGDRLLLCSDGLTGELEDAEIGRLLAEHPDDPERVAHNLVDGALGCGGRDNVSVIVIDY